MQLTGQFLCISSASVVVNIIGHKHSFALSQYTNALYKIFRYIHDKNVHVQLWSLILSHLM
jgi:hypothetical protein